MLPLACALLSCAQYKPPLKYFVLHCTEQGPGHLQTHAPSSDAVFTLHNFNEAAKGRNAGQEFKRGRGKKVCLKLSS